MSTDNKTVVKLCEDGRIALDPDRKNGWSELFDSIEAAHKREIEKLNKCLEYVVDDSNRTCGLCEPSKKILELCECLKEACDTVCSDGLVGCKGAFAYGSKCCLLAECEYHKWRKALEGGEIR